MQTDKQNKTGHNSMLASSAHKEITSPASLSRSELLECATMPQPANDQNDNHVTRVLSFTDKGAFLATLLIVENKKLLDMIQKNFGHDVRVTIDNLSKEKIIVTGPQEKTERVVDCFMDFAAGAHKCGYTQHNDLKHCLKTILRKRYQQQGDGTSSGGKKHKDKKAQSVPMGFNPALMTVNELTPATPNQQNYLRLLNDNEIDAVMVQGPAGTGKTRLFLQVAMRMLRDHYRGVPGANFKKLILSIPLVNVGDRDLGAMPGDLNKKTNMWYETYYDHLIRILSPLDQNNKPDTKIGAIALEELIKAEIVVIAPLEFLRGKSFEGAMMALDETQNALPEQVETFLTRGEKTTRMFLFGDLEQKDRKPPRGEYLRVPSTVAIDKKGIVSIFNRNVWTEIGFHKDIGQFFNGETPNTLDKVAPLNGFAQAFLLYSASPRIACASLTHADIQRSGVARDILVLHQGLRIAENEITNLTPVGRGTVDPVAILNAKPETPKTNIIDISKQLHKTQQQG